MSPTTLLAFLAISVISPFIIRGIDELIDILEKRFKKNYTMRKFKLIKKYPGSWEKDTIAFVTEDKGTVLIDNVSSSIRPSDILNYPQYWKEVIEKDYEILDYYTPQQYWHMEQDAPSLIKSVKRLSDGEIFTIGDEICCVHTKLVYGKITKLWISFEQLRCDIGRLGLVLCNDIDKRNDIIKVPIIAGG